MVKLYTAHGIAKMDPAVVCGVSSGFTAQRDVDPNVPGSVPYVENPAGGRIFILKIHYSYVYDTYLPGIPVRVHA